jgi:hypothetical protein
VDLADSDDARWLLACIWPGTGRLERTAAAIRLAQQDPPRVIRGDAVGALPEVMAGLPEGVAAVVLTTWAFAYFPTEMRSRFVEVLAAGSQRRPVVWLSAERAGIVETFAAQAEAEPDRSEPDVVGVMTFGRGTPRQHLLAYTQQHGRTLDWRA